MKRFLLRLSLVTGAVVAGLTATVLGLRCIPQGASESAADDASAAAAENLSPTAPDPFRGLLSAEEQALADRYDASPQTTVRSQSEDDDSPRGRGATRGGRGQFPPAREVFPRRPGAVQANYREAVETTDDEEAASGEVAAVADDTAPRRFSAADASAIEPPADQAPEEDGDSLAPAAGGNRRPAPAAADGLDADEAADEELDVLPARSAPAATGPEGAGRPGVAQLDGPQTPQVTIEKRAPAEIQIGKEAVFEISVRNAGQAAAHDVEVYDSVPEGTKLVGTNPPAEQTPGGELAWAIGTLKPDEERLLQMTLLPTAEGEIGSVARLYFAAEASVRTLSTRPALALDVTGPREVLMGEQVGFTINVTNPGTGAATGVVIQANLAGGLKHEAGEQLEYDLGTLEPGATRALELTLEAVAAGPVSNLLVVEGEGGLHAEFTSEVDVLAPELQVAVSGPKRRYLEREATYVFSVSNPGTAAAREIELTTYLPEGMEFVKADNYGEYDETERVVRWSLEELPPGETGEVTLTALPIAAGEQKLLIEGAGARGLSARHEQTIMVEGVAAILFTVADVDDPIEVGDQTSYEIRVVNQGSKAAGDVRIVVLIPDGMKAVSAEGPTRFSIADTEVVFDPLPELAAKADTTYRVHVQGLAEGDQRLTVQLLTKDMQDPVTKEESTQVLSSE